MKKELTLDMFRNYEGMTDQKYKDIKNAFNQYKAYNTIRRNLREGYNLINYNIDIRKAIVNEKLPKEDIDMYFSIIESNLFTTIILYGRWFQKTDNKIILNKEDFFNNNKFIECHNEIMKLRNKYVAHNEKDLLGGDSVHVEKDGGDIKITSDFMKQILVSDEKLDNIKKCIEIVHNKIDAEYLPKAEKDLIDEIKIYDIY